jgi:predicted component of type VI protein secretion system
MSALLEVPVKIENIKLPAKNADSIFESEVNKSCLGVDLVLGKVFDDGQYDFKITIGPVSAKKMEYFLDTSVGNTILDCLCNLFFPADAFIIKDFKVIKQDAAFVLSHNKVNSFLGINTFI